MTGEGFDEYKTAREFAGWLTDQLADTGAGTGRWFHYGAVEAQHLRRILGDAAEPLLARATDLLGEVIRPNFYAPGGYGLKMLGGRAGASWRTEGATGADTYEWVAAARKGGEAAWARLIEYNEDDTRATQRLREFLRRETT